MQIELEDDRELTPKQIKDARIKNPIQAKGLPKSRPHRPSQVQNPRLASPKR